jgi:hypothetical protein
MRYIPFVLIIAIIGSLFLTFPVHGKDDHKNSGEEARAVFFVR